MPSLPVLATSPVEGELAELANGEDDGILVSEFGQATGVSVSNAYVISEN